MFGLNLGASIVPFATARAWAATRDPAALMVTALLSALIPLPLMEALHRWQRDRRVALSGVFAALGGADDEETKAGEAVELTDGHVSDARVRSRANGANGDGTGGSGGGNKDAGGRCGGAGSGANVGADGDVDECAQCPGDDSCGCGEGERHRRSKAAAAVLLVLALVAWSGYLAGVVRGDDLDESGGGGGSDDDVGDADDAPDPFVPPVVVPPLGMAAEYVEQHRRAPLVHHSKN